MPLDNAALIFPAVRKNDWSNVFRVSATLTEDVDPALLQQAAAQLKRRFPSMYVRLRKGAFWYYLEETEVPKVRQDYAYPLAHMSKRESRKNCLRIIYYKNRIAVEMFHSVTDGTGGMIYLKTLAAAYLTLKYGVSIPAENGVLCPDDAPTAAELEDSFLRNASPFVLNDREKLAMRLTGTGAGRFRYLTTGVIPADRLLAAAHSYRSTVTVFLAAVMAETLAQLQADNVPLRRQKPVKVTVPVNLRKLYGSGTLRNFVLTLNPGIDPRFGEYTLQELCDTIRAQLDAEATPQRMAGRIAANVKPQQNRALKVVPLFLKNIVMRGVYSRRGEKTGCLNVSNLGRLELPEQMKQYVERLEFIIGVQRSYPNNCSVATFGDTVCINMIRSIRESELERRFFSRLVELGIPVAIESNERSRESCTV